MSATVQLTLVTSGTGVPENQSTGGPITDTVSSAVVSAGSASLTGAFSALAVPTGASELLLFLPTGNTIDITFAGANTDTGIVLGSGWTWAKVPVKAASQANVYLKAASSTTINYSFK